MGSVTNDSYFWPWHPVVVKAVTEVRPLDRVEAVHVLLQAELEARAVGADPADAGLD